MNQCESLSGIIFSQNAGTYDPGAYVPVRDNTMFYQEFTLPSDFVRGDNVPVPEGFIFDPTNYVLVNPPDEKLDYTVQFLDLDESDDTTQPRSSETDTDDRLITTLVPPISGFQVLCGIDDGLASVAAIDWTLDHYDVGGWETLASGTQVGAHVSNDEVWFDIFFDKPVPIKFIWLDDQFRLGVAPHFNSAPQQRIPITLTDKAGTFQGFYITESGQSVAGGFTPGFAAYLPNGDFVDIGYPYPDSTQTITDPSGGGTWLIYFDSTGAAYASQTGGVSRFWFTYPAPNTNWGCYTANGPVQYKNQNVNFKFRLLAGVGDTGKDILNNPSRSVIVSSGASNLDTFKDKAPSDFWLSKPNPSQFAVETLYFDISTDGNAQVVDNIYLDPLTPGIYFNIYYSNDVTPGTDLASWDAHFWTQVPQSFLLQQAQNYVLPAPITAKYIALEFQQLQPQQYDPGEFNLPITYRKFPLWVLEYFTLRLASGNHSEDNFVPSQVQVNYNALSFAYNYYLDDINQQPQSFIQLSPNTNTNILGQFLSDRSSTSDKVDPQTLSLISLNFRQFQQAPGLATPLNSILSYYSTATANNNYSTEGPPTAAPISTSVSSLNREALIVNKSMPVMYFYVTSRHLYREVSAPLSYNRAYFAGLKSVAFTRNHYTVRADDSLYIEGVGDNTNVEINDFFTASDFSWITYDTRGH